jgi:hypothetical protein
MIQHYTSRPKNATPSLWLEIWPKEAEAFEAVFQGTDVNAILFADSFTVERPLSHTGAKRVRVELKREQLEGVFVLGTIGARAS